MTAVVHLLPAGARACPGRGTAGRRPRRAPWRWSRGRPSAGSSADRAARASSIREPSSKRAATSSERMSSRESSSGSARRSAISASRSAVGVGEHSRHPAMRREPAQALEREPDRQRRASRGENSDEVAAQLGATPIVLDPEDRAEDHLERDRLHALVERGIARRAARPRPRARWPPPSPARRRAFARRGTAAA